MCDFFLVLLYMELTFKDTLMFYQTSLRNVGLYTSIALALLGVSRFYRGQRGLRLQHSIHSSQYSYTHVSIFDFTES
jgi:hypothetical protein